ncbi:MAG: Uma2 family endonuclease [Persicimonas sp.]
MALSPDIPQEHHWTVADYMELDDERRFEVYQGELVMVPSPNIYHQRAITRLGTLLDAYAVEGGVGEVFDAPFDVALSEDTVVQPDLTFVSKERLRELYDGHCITGAPDLVVEVLSPATESRDRHRKRELYSEAGVPWLLLVEPKGQVVEVLRLGEEGRYIIENSAAEDDVLTVGLFPGLEIDLSKVWFELPEDEGEQ